MNNTSNQDIDNTQFAFQLMGMLFTIVPLIISEILPFCPCEPNGLCHAFFVSCSNLNKKRQSG